MHTPLKMTIMPSPIFLLFSLSFILPTSLSSPPSILNLCKSTQFPLTCQSSLNPSPNPSPSPSPTPTHIIQTTLTLTSHYIKKAQSMAQTILTTFPNHHNRTKASLTCLDLLSLSSYRTRTSLNSLSSRDSLFDARAWASAALTYQYDCWSELSYVNGTRVVDQTMQFLNSSLMQTTSNALSLLHALINYGHDPATWQHHPPLTERDGFWDKGSGSGSESGLGFGGVISYGEDASTLLTERDGYSDKGSRPGPGSGLGYGGVINYGEDTSTWKHPPLTERDGFWGKWAGAGSGLGFGFGKLDLKGSVNVTVCKEGKARGCYAKVQEAVNDAPAWMKVKGKGRYVIYIKEGVYEENVRVGLEKRNLVFLGDGRGKTVITGSVNTGIMGISTYNTATVGIKGDGFMASGITFQNSAGPNSHQAVAFRSDSDFSLIEDCEFLGNQDTLYAHSLRQVYKSCHIEGNVDFIFGNAAALFQDCTILVRPRQVDPTKGENNAITAQGRTDPAEATGFVFLDCLVNGTNEYMKLRKENPKVHKTFLGRPWKMYSRTVFIACMMEDLISPEGWMPFRDEFALSTLYYGEFGNKGQGADMANRVKWCSQIPEVHLNAYSAQSFLQANEWKITGL